MTKNVEVHVPCESGRQKLLLWSRYYCGIVPVVWSVGVRKRRLSGPCYMHYGVVPWRMLKCANCARSTLYEHPRYMAFCVCVGYR